jgi:hypothetical protein
MLNAIFRKWMIHIKLLASDSKHPLYFIFIGANLPIDELIESKADLRDHDTDVQFHQLLADGEVCSLNFLNSLTNVKHPSPLTFCSLISRSSESIMLTAP